MLLEGEKDGDFIAHREDASSSFNALEIPVHTSKRWNRQWLHRCGIRLTENSS